MSAVVRSRWSVCAPGVAVFLSVLVAQLVLIAIAGTDMPFQDQWNVEGQWLYPKLRDGTLTPADVFQPLNEHRIVWTHLLNLSLFQVAGQWDPLLQLLTMALMRASCAAGVAVLLGQWCGGRWRVMVTVAVAVAFLPHLAWHSVLWGIESQVYFALGFSLLALAFLTRDEFRPWHAVAGVSAGLAGLLAMAPAMLVPLALVVVAAVRLNTRRELDRSIPLLGGGAAALLVVAWLLHVPAPEHESLRPQTSAEFVSAAARVLSWPHVAMPPAALILNAPVVLLVLQRIRRKRVPRAGEDFVLGAAAWSALVALATAWARGGSPELQVGVPSRYADFVVLLPLANVWSAVVLAHEASASSKVIARTVALSWCAFLCIGWLGLSSEVLRGIVLPRARDREAPIRLVREFQVTSDAAVFIGQRRLLVPHPNPESVRAVLTDPRMRGALPPSLQPEAPVNPWSQAARALLRQ
jgi:hypothetical protein